VHAPGRGATTHRTAERAELPVEDADDAVLGRVEDHVVELVVAMDDAETGLALVGQVCAVPREERVELGDHACLLSALDVDDGGLRERDAREGLDLPREVRRRGSEGGEAELGGVERGERGERADSGEPASKAR
jgi:hypothetical protein